MKKLELLKLKKKFLEKNNLLILIKEDGSQELYDVKINHVITLVEILKKEDYIFYEELLNASPEILSDFVFLATECVKKNIIIICKSIDIYGIYLSNKINNSQIVKLVTNILLINHKDMLYSGIYNDKNEKYEYFNDGCYMKKKKFLNELYFKRTN